MNNLRYKFSRSCVIISLLLVTIWLSPSVLPANEGKKPKKLVLYPTPVPRPALTYQLLPTVRERRPGNAAVFYGKVESEENAFFHNKELQNKLHSLLNAPLEELRNVKEIDYIPLRQLKRGVLCEDCDMQIPIREDGFATFLPAIQGYRQYARYLLLIARKQIAQGKFDEAVETMKCGYALGRHTGNNPCIVTGLVGNAIIGITSDAVEDLIQQPGAPNLYWALTNLPHPLIDLRQNMDGEILGFDASFPELLDVDKPIEDPGYWRYRYWETVKMLDRVTGMWGDTNSRETPAMLFSRALRSYQIAKRALIERGMTADKVEAMPVGQAILMATARIYEEMQDESLRSCFLPFWEAKPIMDRAQKNLVHIARRQEEPLPVGSLLLPAIGGARSAFVRLEQRIAFLRVIEALRLHGAANGGRLPKLLADITEVPIPVDPVTGKPFIYELRGDTALLEAAPLPGYQLRYEISFGPK